MIKSVFRKLIGLISLVLVVLLVLVSWNIYSITHVAIIDKNTPDLIITLDRSTSANQFVRILKDKNVISCPKLFLWMIRVQGLAHQLKAGVYQVKPGETVAQLLNKVVTGDVITQNFSIIAGSTAEKIAQDLKTTPYIHYQADDWASIKGDYLNAEGLLLAETYQYEGGSSGKALLSHANKKLMAALAINWGNRAANLPFKSPYELLIAASIIEKETGIREERRLIAGVIVNRIKKGMPLQMDPTVIYGLGRDYHGKLSHNDLLIDTPYNTYRYRGLPPTPIAMVGNEAIDAAAHPQASNYLYYVARGDGSHQFSENYEQQKQAIEKYQRKDS